MEVKRGEDSDEGVNILYIILWKPMADSDDDVIHVRSKRSWWGQIAAVRVYYQVAQYVTVVSLHGPRELWVGQF